MIALLNGIKINFNVNILCIIDQNKIDFHLDKVFKKREEYIKYNFNIYHKIYGLGTIFYEDNVSEALFEYCKKETFLY